MLRNLNPTASRNFFGLLLIPWHASRWRRRVKRCGTTDVIDDVADDTCSITHAIFGQPTKPSRAVQGAHAKKLAGIANPCRTGAPQHTTWIPRRLSRKVRILPPPGQRPCSSSSRPTAYVQRVLHDAFQHVFCAQDRRAGDESAQHLSSNEPRHAQPPLFLALT